MCGIVGIAGPHNPAFVDAMNASIIHRGPDDAGAWIAPDGSISLAMRRLAIVDLTDGHQPMSSADGRFTIVYNGEIYNAGELRREMEAAGVRFRTDHSDTEVLLEMFALHGTACLGRLNGMFAFAIYDGFKRSLTLVRDRLGIKPLYWRRQDARFSFASELKSLVTLPGGPGEVDRRSLFDYMSLMYVPGTATIFSGVERLAPGTWLEFDIGTGALRTGRWWAPAVGVGALSCGAGAAAPETAVRHALEEAVASWSIADVPVGCSLSGGLDSSAVVGLLARAGHRVRTYSVGYSGKGERAWDELPLARQVAEKWGTDHHEIIVDPESLLDDLVAMVWHLDEPYGGGLPSWMVFREMARDVKVGMTGTGGDELFGNYGKWRELEGNWAKRMFAAMPDQTRFTREFFDRYYYFGDDQKRQSVFSAWAAGIPDTAERLFTQAYLVPASGAIRDRCAYVDIVTQLPEEFLMMTDRFSMAHSIEARTPFLDHRLVELALAFPGALRTDRRDLKGLLRRAIADLLPPALLSAPKRGFVIPLSLWLRGRLKPLAMMLLAPERLAGQGLFAPAFFASYVLPHVEGRADHTQKVWAALMFQLWHLVFVERGGRKPDFDTRALTQ